MRDLQLLKNMVEIDSSTVDGQNKMIELLQDYLTPFANKIKIIGKERKNILAFFGNVKSDNILLFNGHVDTVSVSKKDCKFNPFSLVEQDDFWYGRGTGDMKGGIYCVLNAIIQAQNDNLLNDKLMIFAGTCDEETGSNSSFGASAVVDYFLKENLIPSACVIPEPNKQNVPIKLNLGHRGLIWIKATSSGVRMHSGSIEKEDNAITNVTCFLNKLRKKLTNQPQKNSKGMPCSSARVTGIYSDNNEFNVVPTMCEANIDIRVSPQDKNKDVLKKVQKLAVKYGVKLEVVKNTPSSQIKKNERIVQELLNICEENNFECELGYSSATCDAHFFNNEKIPTVVGVGVDAKNVHANDECITKQSLQKCEEVFYSLIKKW